MDSAQTIATKRTKGQSQRHMDDYRRQSIGVWEKLPNENMEHYERFCIYRDMGTKRSMTRTTRALGMNVPRVTVNHKQVEKAPRTITRLSQQFEWLVRAQAYDAWKVDAERHRREGIAETQSEIWAVRATELRERKFAAGDKMLRAVEARLRLSEGEEVDEYGNIVKVEARPIRITDKDIPLFIKAAVLLAGGAATPPKSAQQPDDLSNLPLDPSEWTEEQQGAWLSQDRARP